MIKDWSWYSPQGADEQELVARELSDLCQGHAQYWRERESCWGYDGPRQDGEDDGVDKDDIKGRFFLPSWPELCRVLACGHRRPCLQGQYYQGIVQVILRRLGNEDCFHALSLVSRLHSHEEEVRLAPALYVIRSKWASSTSASTPARLPPISISVPGICPPSFNSALMIPKGMFE